MNKIKSLLLFLLVFFGNYFVFSIDKENYISNSYYLQIVAKIENELINIETVKNVNVYKASNPFPFTPDLFSIELKMKNDHTYIFECIPATLSSYRNLSNIRYIDGKEYITVISVFGIKKSYKGIVLSKISEIENLKIKNLKDFLRNEDIFYKFFTTQEKTICHPKNSQIKFYKVN